MSKHVAKLASSLPPVAVVRELLQRVRGIGGDADSILARAGLAHGADACSPASWGRQLSREQFVAIYRDCVVVLEEHVSRRAGRPAMNKTEVDLLCYCLISCTTLEQAIGRAADFCAMLGGRAGELSLRTAGTTVEFRMHTFHEKRDVSALLSDLTGLSTYARLFGWLIGADLAPLTVELCYRRFLEDRVVAWLMPYPVTYEAADNHLCFPVSYLHQPVVRSAGELDELLKLFPFDLTTEQSKSTPLSRRVSTILGTALAHRAVLPTTIQIAAQFGISAATLKRRLAGEETTMQDLKDRCRHELALDLLRDRSMPFGEIALRLGFSDAASFARAFRNWSGRSPSDYRRAALAPISTRASSRPSVRMGSSPTNATTVTPAMVRKLAE